MKTAPISLSRFARRATLALAIFAATFGLTSHSNAAVLTWDSTSGTAGAQDGAGTWASGAPNWRNTGTSTDNQNFTNGDSVTFGAASGAAGNVTINGTVTTNSLTFAAPGSGSYTLVNGASTPNLNLSAASVITVNSSVTPTIAATITGTNGFTKAGLGTLTLSNNANSYTGLTSVNEGRLIVTGKLGNNSSAFVDTGATLEYKNTNNWSGNLTGQGTVEINATQPTFSGNNTAFAGTVNVLNGARLNLSGGGNAGSANAAWVTTGTGILSMTGSGTYEFGSLSGSVGSFAGTGGSATALLRIGALNTDTTFNGTLTGSGTNQASFEKVGTGTLTITGIANPYAGTTTISNGTLEVKKVANSGLTSSIGASTNASTNLVINGGTLKFSGTTGNGSTNRLFTIGTNGATIDGSSSDNTALTFTNTGSLATTAGATGRTLTLTGTTSAATLNSIASIIVDPTGGGKTAVTKTGGNTWVLSGANTYTGTTTVTAGTLKVEGALLSNHKLLGSNFIAAPDSMIAGNPILTRRLVEGASYSNLGSTSVGGLSSTAELLAGVVDGPVGPGHIADVSMQWRTRTGDETTGTPTTPRLISNVLDLTGVAIVSGITTDLFVLQMNYDSTGATGGPPDIYLGTFDTDTNSWVNAVATNNGTNNAAGLQLGYLGTFDSFQTTYGTTLDDYRGAWGVDVSSKVAWAVLNHNSEFAVIPEPSTLVLGGLAILGFASVRLRRNRKQA